MISQLKVLNKERENSRRKSVAAKNLAGIAKEKEGVRKKLAVTARGLKRKAKNLAVTAYKKEDVRKKLEITAQKLKLKAAELAALAKEKEEIRKNLEKTAAEKEKARKELALTAEQLKSKAAELATLAIATREASQYARSLIEASLDPLVTIDVKGKITDVNSATGLVTGIPREELIGTDFSIYFSEPEKAREGYKKVFKEGSVIDYPLTIRNKNGRLVDVLYNASVYKNEKGKVLGIFAAARDVTLAKKASEEAAIANKEMEAFSYSVSHDLRAPLRAIDGFTQILVEQYGAKLDEEGKRITSVIRASTVQMGKLIDDLLSFSRLGRQAVTKKPVSMATLVNEVCTELRKASPQRDIEFIARDLLDVKADIDMMRVVWMNLLSNAIKFTSKKDKARIEVSSKNDNGIITYYVKDNGAGFDMKYIDKLFGVFQRLHSVEEFEGTGVGLANVKRIIERHGGKVWAEGKVGEGATIYFTLPTI